MGYNVHDQSAWDMESGGDLFSVYGYYRFQVFLFQMSRFALCWFSICTLGG
jgi:hypothetical protein